MLGFTDVFWTRTSNGCDQTEIVKTIDDPLGWVPIQFGRARPVIMGKCVLFNGKCLIYRVSGRVSDMLNKQKHKNEVLHNVS